MSEPKPPPDRRWERTSRLAGLGVGTGWSLLTHQRMDRMAEHAAEVLGTLRGLAAKAGQIMGSVEGVLPDGMSPAYQRALSKLRAAAPSSPYTEVSKIVHDDLGATPEEVFAEFETQPFASASIGQVHRARLRDGREAAVKVQHPGIDRAVQMDLLNAGLLSRLASSLAPKGMDTARVYREIADRFREELDYRLEATNQRRFRALHRIDPAVVIPEVFLPYSTRRVLTTELLNGVTLEQAATVPESLRHDYAALLWRFVYRSILVGGVFNADPHPGNYLFRPDGSIVFLDFGCVQAFPVHRLKTARAAHWAAVRRDEAAFSSAVRQMLSLQGGPYEELIQAYMRRCFAPVFDSPFKLTRAFCAELLGMVRSAGSTLIRQRGSMVPIPSGLAMMNRLQFGFFSVLSRLDVSVDYARVEEGILDEVETGADPSTRTV